MNIYYRREPEIMHKKTYIPIRRTNMVVNNVIRVNSEIGKLKKVLLHKPGKEIENLTPELLDRLLFDDIPYLEVATKEHDYFADIFRKLGVEVVYLVDLVAETLDDIYIRHQFIDEVISEAGIVSHYKRQILSEYLKSIGDANSLVATIMEGVKKTELHDYSARSLGDMVRIDYPFLLDPMPNLYFTRDPFSIIGSGVAINHMRTVTRNRETIFGKYIFKYNKKYANIHIPRWYDRDMRYSIEGGDQLVLNKNTIAIGISERTDPESVEIFAKNIFTGENEFNRILAFDIPKKRAFMHLDTVFTMVDRDKFTIHPEIEGPLTVYSITPDEKEIIIEKESLELEEILKKYLNLDSVTLIRCGGGHGVDASREQWSDGSNTLAVAPGEVIVYSRNHVTNRLLEEAGVKLHVMPSSELSRGRGGPRCMSMPLYRDDL